MFIHKYDELQTGLFCNIPRRIERLAGEEN